MASWGLHLILHFRLCHRRQQNTLSCVNDLGQEEMLSLSPSLSTCSTVPPSPLLLPRDCVPEAVPAAATQPERVPRVKSKLGGEAAHHHQHDRDVSSRYCLGLCVAGSPEGPQDCSPEASQQTSTDALTPGGGVQESRCRIRG